MIRFPLMRNNIAREDLDLVIEHLRQDDPILTNGPQVRAFEEEWSRWLGVKYSVFVNSGSSANLMSMTLLKLAHPEGGEIIVPPLTWISDVAAVLQTGFTPVFVDIDPTTLALDTEKTLAAITDRTRAVFLTHAQGYDGLTDALLEGLAARGVPLIEDVCESHGATHGGRRVGSFGQMSNFSFYYAHHMSTIEGGMVSTDDFETYQKLRMLRSHGMVRESNDAAFKGAYLDAHPDLNPDFIFAFPAYNMRNTEIGAIIGRNQLKTLDERNLVRSRNHDLFLDLIDGRHYRKDFKREGSSNYAFNLVLRDKDDALMARLQAALRAEGIEFRRGSAGGGNQLRQPYLRGLVPEGHHANFPVVDHVHFYGMYIGNFPDLSEDEVRQVVAVINSAVA